MGNDFKPDFHQQPNLHNDHTLSNSTFHNLGELPQPVLSHLSKYKPYETQLSLIKNDPFKILKGNEIYQGKLKEKNIPEGFGKIVRKDGSLLLANFTEGKAEGKGTFIFNDGAYYEGEFRNSMAEGKGKLTKDNLIYEGDFERNMFNGKGELKVGRKYRFQGYFVNGKKRKGQLKWYQGENDKAICQYKGTFNDKESFHGQGTLKNKYGVYEGTFQNGYKHGKGQFKFKNGPVYVGSYQEDVRSGKGILYNMEKVDGKITYSKRQQLISYRGDFKNGLPDGKGEIFNKGLNKFEESDWIEGLPKTMLS